MEKGKGIYRKEEEWGQAEMEKGRRRKKNNNTE